MNLWGIGSVRLVISFQLHWLMILGKSELLQGKNLHKVLLCDVLSTVLSCTCHSSMFKAVAIVLRFLEMFEITSAFLLKF